MLVDFKIKNFMSFKNEIFFSMEKGNKIRKYKDNVLKTSKIDLLKSATIFGANASGKTNLLGALDLFKSIVTEPTMSETQNMPYITFAYNDKNIEFEIRFIVQDEIFNYSLEYNKNEIVSEFLYIGLDDNIKDFDNKMVFKREYQNFIKLPKQLEPIRENIRKNQTLLHFAQYNNVKEAKIAYSWFDSIINISNIDTNNVIVDNNTDINMFDNYIFKSLKDPNLKSELLRVLNYIGLNIEDIKVTEKQINRGNTTLPPFFNTPGFPNKNITIYELSCVYKKRGSQKFSVDFSYESAGTKKLVILITCMLLVKNKKSVICIDEFDKSFHKELSEILLDLFNYKNNQNQFILTTHNLSLMNHNLRRDQIWFVEKDKFGESQIYSMYDFDSELFKKIGFDNEINYLRGTFGANPIINNYGVLDVFDAPKINNG